jgi:hypothetical protein
VHPFLLARLRSSCKVRDLGAFAADLKAFACESAWITNGADSFRFPLTELGLFHGAGAGGGGGQPEIYRGEQRTTVR